MGPARPEIRQETRRDLTAYEEKLTRVRSLARKQDRVLEIGCGTGSTALRIAPRVAHMTATDISVEMIRIARSKLGANARNDIAIHKADAAQVVQGHLKQPFHICHLAERRKALAIVICLFDDTSDAFGFETGAPPMYRFRKLMYRATYDRFERHFLNISKLALPI